MKDRSRDPLDALLYASAGSAGKNETEAYENASSDLKLTSAEQKKMIARARDPHGVKKRALSFMKRAAVIVLVAMSVSIACAMSVDSVRESFWQSVLEMGTYHADIRYVTVDNEVLPDTIVQFKEPYPGENYIRHEIGKSKYKYHIEYTDGDITFTYSQTPLKDYQFTVTEHYSSGKVRMEEIEVAGCDGYRIETNSMSYLNWHDNVYVYSLGGNVPLTELLRIAGTLQ